MLTVAAVIWLEVLIHERNLGQNVLNLVILITIGAAGLVVARAQPRNPVGWLLLASALGLALSYAGGSYAVLIYRQGHRALPFGPVAVLLNLLWAPGIVTLGRLTCSVRSSARSSPCTPRSGSAASKCSTGQTGEH